MAKKNNTIFEEVNFELERETKGTHVYKEMEPLEGAEYQGQIIGSLYIKKKALEHAGVDAPSTITVQITTGG